ncbi:hypothetical protein [Streptomyces cinereoruber]|uniref:hypothetical protein n=1 Tax=Streptomyces cinereoruber TaxID=67260 RepID=UPI003639F31C
MATHTHMRRVRPRNTALQSAGAFLLASSFFLVSCSGEKGAESKPPAPATTPAAPTPTSAAPTTPAPDPTEETKNQLVSLYRSYWGEMEKAYSLGSTKETKLSQYAAGVALTEAEKNVTTHSTAGRTTTGSVGVNNTTVTDLNLKAKLPLATLSTCLDISKWNLIDRATKKKVELPSDRLTRYVITTKIEKWPQGWRIVLDEPQEQTC